MYLEQALQKKHNSKKFIQQIIEQIPNYENYLSSLNEYKFDGKRGKNFYVSQRIYGLTSNKNSIEMTLNGAVNQNDENRFLKALIERSDNPNYSLLKTLEQLGESIFLAGRVTHDSSYKQHIMLVDTAYEPKTDTFIVKGPSR